jgi:UDPglucose 6-dehydrogenase
VGPVDLVVVGIGHVGLVTAAALAAAGHRVAGIDDDRERVRQLRNGFVPFYEPGLQDLVARGVAQGRLRFEDDPARAVPGAEVAFLCVGTPARETGEANLIAVESAARGVARHLTGPAVLAEKSTVPAGTAERLARVLRIERPDLGERIDVVSNPEFLREGRAVQDAVSPDRILVGADSERGFETMRRVYDPMIDAGSELIETDITTAELAKHACNAFLAMKVSYVNAIARLCERAGADVTAVSRVMGSDERIGPHFLDAGLGWGGYCFPKDLQAFERLAERLGYDFGLLREVARINDEALDAAFDKVCDALWNVEGKRVALLGLAFKPGTDDVRFSPALALARRLLERDASVVGYDPEAAANAKSEVAGLEVAPTAYDALEGAHCAVVCTEWDDLRSLDLERVRQAMTTPIVVDGRNVFDPVEMRRLGFVHAGMGRGAGPRTV